MTTTTAADTLAEILRLWPELDVTPTGRRRDVPGERTAEQRARALERWQDELTDKQAGAIGRGASPAPGNLDQLEAKGELDTALCELADRVAAHVQPPARPSTPYRWLHVSLTKGRPNHWHTDLTPADPNRWNYCHHIHGGAWAVTWILGALDRGVPTLVLDDVTITAQAALRRLRIALDGQTERTLGPCPACKTRLTVADWDDVVVCSGCGATYGRRRWLHLRMTGGAA